MSLRSALQKRLGASVHELERTRLQDRCRGLDVTSLDQLPLRRPVRVGGEVQRVMIAPRNGVPNFEVMIGDGTGAVTAVFAGRRSIAGIEHGRAIVLEGVAVDRRGQPVIFNPLYTLVP
jgi:DNA/RNA endonuclease YhcR with UshA esterase domain